jgi:hypothetical protein
MELAPGIRTMDALGRLVLQHRPQGRLGIVEHGRRCL